MGVTTTRTSPDARPAAAQRLALAVADANWFTTENLFREVPGRAARTLLLQCIDYNNAFRRGLPPWAWGRALRQSGPVRVAARPGAALRLDEEVPAAGHAAHRPVDPPLARPSTRPDGRFALVMTYPALPLPARPGPARPAGLLQHRRLLAILAAPGRRRSTGSNARPCARPT